MQDRSTRFLETRSVRPRIFLPGARIFLITGIAVGTLATSPGCDPARPDGGPEPGAGSASAGSRGAGVGGTGGAGTTTGGAGGADAGSADPGTPDAGTDDTGGSAADGDSGGSAAGGDSGAGGAPGPAGERTVCINADGQSSADGQDTYALLESVLGANCIENPDTDHMPLFRHVKEEMDDEVGPHFAVYVHKNDSDMGRDNGKNRVEIKVHTGAADVLKATENETITYTWRFKMAADMVFSPRFNAMFQIKSFGGNAGLPVLNIKVQPGGGAERLIVEYIGDGGGAVRSLSSAPVMGNKGVWLQVFLRLEVKNNGSVFMTIKRPDGTPVISIDEKGLDVWRQGEYLRPKWGLYRGKADSTRDLEIVRFASFGITPGPNPTSDCTRP